MPDIETNSYIQYTQSELLSIESKSMPYATIILEPGKKFNFTHKGNCYSFQCLKDVNYGEDLINNQNPIGLCPKNCVNFQN